MKQQLIAFLNAEDWAASQAYLEQHQADLFTFVADQELAKMQAHATNPSDKQLIAAHRALIQRAMTIGIPQAYAELARVRQANPDLPLLPIPLVDVLNHLRTLSPARLKAYLEANPEIRQQLLELGLVEARQNTSLDRVILAFLNASTWADKRRLLAQNQTALFSAGAVIWFEEALRKALGDEVNTLVLQAHQHLLTRCQEIGIGEAFAEAEAALQAAKDAGQDVNPPR